MTEIEKKKMSTGKKITIVIVAAVVLVGAYFALNF